MAADAMEARGQDVEQETAGELVNGECHRLPPSGTASAIDLVADGASWRTKAKLTTKVYEGGPL